MRDFTLSDGSCFCCRKLTNPTTVPPSHSSMASQIWSSSLLTRAKIAKKDLISQTRDLIDRLFKKVFFWRGKLSNDSIFYHWSPAHAPPEVKPLELRYVWVDPVGGEDPVLLLDLLKVVEDLVHDLEGISTMLLHQTNYHKIPFSVLESFDSGLKNFFCKEH